VGKTQQNRSQNVVGYGEATGRKTDLGAGYWISELPPRQPRFQNFATGAVVLSRARIALHRILSLAEDPIMCDTDSVATTSAMAELPGLGGLHLEGHGEMLTVAPKVYAKDFGKGLEYKVKGAVRSNPRMTEKERKKADENLAQLLGGEKVSLRAIPTQFELWDRGRLELESWRPYRLHLDRVKRKYDSRGNSRSWTVMELLEGAHETPVEDRGIFERMLAEMR
jgi:hypothetical protein